MKTARASARPARTSSPHAELLALHRRIWLENRRRIDAGTVDDTGELERYRRAYTSSTRGYSAVTTFDALVDACFEGAAVYVGDFHTSKQSQKCYLKLVRRLHDKGAKVALGLELIGSRYQKEIDRFLAGTLSEAAFLKKISFEKNWPFGNWENFSPIFEFARKTGSPILALDKKIDGRESLTRRDAHAAGILADSHIARPSHIHVTLFGDLHVAKQHLPRAVESAILDRYSKTGREADAPLQRIVYQNSEAVYWKLAEQGLERSTEVVRLGSHEFCVINTPPIILQQTYLNWLEREEDVLDYADARTEFLTLVRRIAGFLEIDLPEAKAEEVEVYTAGDLSFLDRLRERRLFEEKEIAEIKRQIRTAESYMIPRGRIVYLANLSTNHAAEEASHFLKILCAPEELPMERVAAFYANALHEAIGFFGSKIINHRRKTPHEREFERILSTRGRYPALVRRVATLVLAHKRLELGKLPPKAELLAMYRQPVDVFIGVTHALGYILGEKLFYAMLAGSIPKALVRDIYFDPLTAPGRARRLYFELAARLAKTRIPERS